MLFEKIPGYRLVKAFTKEGPLVTADARTLRPALAAIEEGECPALVMDEFADGRLVVFVPGRRRRCRARSTSSRPTR